jgi:hypothetical protein
MSALWNDQEMPEVAGRVFVGGDMVQCLLYNFDLLAPLLVISDYRSCCSDPVEGKVVML